MLVMPYAVPLLTSQQLNILSRVPPHMSVIGKQPVDVNVFLPCRSGADFLSLAPGWERTMTNTTHISCVQGRRADRQGDTGVVCFCQKHRNSLQSPPGVDKAGVHSLACCRGGMCSCCDYLPLQRKGFL